MKVTTKRKITEELTLKNFEWEWVGIYHKKGSNAALVEVLFDGENQRSFTIPVPIEWTDEAIVAELIKLPQFKGSK